MAEITQVTFLLNNQKYGIDILNVRAIEKCDGITSVLGAPDFIEGVVNIRGEMIPVYSISRKFSLVTKPLDEESRLVIVNLPELPVAILVDSVEGIVTVSESHTTTRPKMMEQTATSFVGRVVELDKKIMLLLDMDSLIPQAERKAMIDMLTKGKHDEEQ
ncbi:MAG: chemotaxis protein CheW [Lachnospiraceae bacterium]|nr:chemotaxis protein CheW [Lachnospiraceae bacterium]